MGIARPSENFLLRRLPRPEWAILAPLVEHSALVAGAVICAAGDRIPRAVFPLSGIVALIASVPDGPSIHSGLIGRDGVFGWPLSVGVSRSSVEARIEGDGVALTIQARLFVQALVRCPVLHLRVQQSGVRLMDQAVRIAACNAHHATEARTARWILQASDRMSSDVVAIKQSSLAAMLGMLRPSISQAAGALQRRGLVVYQRGALRVVDRAGLEAAACSCYTVMAGADASRL